jgi:hypothetical protein
VGLYATMSISSAYGRTWTAQYAGITQPLFNVTWLGSQFVALGYGGTGGTILTSPDGHTWTAQNSATSQALWGVTWSGSQFVVVGDT